MADAPVAVPALERVEVAPAEALEVRPVGVAAAVLPSWGYAPVLLLACALAVGSAILCVKLRQPGRFLPGLPPQRVATSGS